ncbi:hypothetical protein J7J62_04115 [bacterium]|nr:hypothetical protein [bacterium]
MKSIKAGIYDAYHADGLNLKIKLNGVTVKAGTATFVGQKGADYKLIDQGSNATDNIVGWAILGDYTAYNVYGVTDNGDGTYTFSKDKERFVITDEEAIFLIKGIGGSPNAETAIKALRYGDALKVIINNNEQVVDLDNSPFNEGFVIFVGASDEEAEAGYMRVKINTHKQIVVS